MYCLSFDKDYLLVYVLLVPKLKYKVSLLFYLLLEHKLYSTKS
jgi:hypothetical protein